MDIGQKSRWLSGAALREQLKTRAADPPLAAELDKLAGQTLGELSTGPEDLGR